MKNLRKSRPRLILHILMALCAVGILCSVFLLFSDSREYAKSDAAYQLLRMTRETSGPSTDQEGAPFDTIGEALSEEKQEEHINEVNFASLEGINPDVVGWIAAEGAEIDYPVVQGEDNDFYLRHLFTGERNKLGSIFMDYRNQGDFSDRNTIIYGHNMKDGSMFSSLTKYNDQRYYDSLPTMLLYTPAGNFMIELFAGTVVDGDYESIRLDFEGAQDFRSYIDSLEKNSTFESNTIVRADDRIITLCTCSYEFNNARYTLCGKLTPLH